MSRAYGPHDDTAAPSSVTVGRGALEREIPVAAAVLEQRRRINAIAHQAGAGTYPPGVSS